ncbi:MAG: hypothetical protein KDA27_18700, partial [Candidatus Eisenbacteria bacterium]|nr:hypothetical protein [Candidatus Eisenbacteria bacterium]
VRLQVFDVSGSVVRTLVDEEFGAESTAQVVWDGRDGEGREVPEGVYLYQLQAAGTSMSRKVLIVR